MPYNKEQEEQNFKNYREFHNKKVYEKTYEMLEYNFNIDDIKILKKFLNDEIEFNELTPNAERAWVFMRMELNNLL
jgi:hypothetical protein